MHQMTVEHDRQVAVVTVSGELDLAAAGDAEQRLRPLEGRQVATLVVDLRRVSFIDSSGLRLIVALDARARANGRRVLIIRGSDQVDRVFKITRLETQLTFVDDPADLPETLDSGT